MGNQRELNVALSESSKWESLKYTNGLSQYKEFLHTQYQYTLYYIKLYMLLTIFHMSYYVPHNKNINLI